jgi:hypothetical protein
MYTFYEFFKKTLKHIFHEMDTWRRRKRLSTPVAEMAAKSLVPAAMLEAQYGSMGAPVS